MPGVVKWVAKESHKKKERQNIDKALLATAVQETFEIPKNTCGDNSA